MRFGGLIAAIVVAALAAVIVLRMSSNSAAPATTPAAQGDGKTVNIYVAATPIPVGSAITAEMVASQPWPAHLALDGFVKAGSDSGNVVGMVARAPFQQNEPIISSKLSNPNDPNFLAGDLPAGMRVITIPVNEVDGIAGFVFPGDHVDLLYTHDVEKWETTPTADTRSAQMQKVKRTITETILTNVKVLAVDQRSSNAGAVDKNGKLVVPKSASLMVSQTDAQRVRLAQKTGTVSLTLRATADREASDPLILTQGKDISQDAPATAATASDDSVRILRGAPRVESESAKIAGPAAAMVVPVAPPQPAPAQVAP